MLLEDIVGGVCVCVCVCVCLGEAEWAILLKKHFKIFSSETSLFFFSLDQGELLQLFPQFYNGA